MKHLGLYDHFVINLLPIYQEDRQRQQEIIECSLSHAKNWWADNLKQLCDGIAASSLLVAEKENCLERLLCESKSKKSKKLDADIAETLFRLRTDNLRSCRRAHGAGESAR